MVTAQSEDDDLTLDAVFDEVEYELNKIKVKSELLYNTLMEYIITEQFDSDAFCLDLYDNNDQTSNIVLYLSNKFVGDKFTSLKDAVNLVSDICNSMAYNVNVA